MIQQVLFLIVLSIVGFLAFRSYGHIYRSIRLGKPEEINGDSGTRWKNVLLVAFGQKKMFKRIIPAVLHLFIYVAFLFTQIELIEIIVDGVFGVHRFFAPALGGLYTLIINTIEFLSLGALIATVVFLYRRNLLKVPRLVMPEMKGWPSLDANNILYAEIVLILAIFTMNGADGLLQNIDPEHYPDTGHLVLSSIFGGALFSGMSEGTLHILERAGWWIHIMLVFGLLLYLPISKHLHILLAFPNVYFSKLKSRGEMQNMPEIMNEVKSMMGLTEESGEADMTEELPDFGVKDIFGLSWKNILDAYTCTECGRCSSVCPANSTGKKLSPRKIVMDVRDRTTEVAAALKDKKYDVKDYDDGKSLFDYISDEELFACTTCNACVEACPVMINPLEPILELRRYRILSDSAGPGDWTPMFTSLENNGSVWQMPNERIEWAKALDTE
jgi:heterodisulfide reductase subunit C